MYDDLVKQHGMLWLYGSILVVLPRLLPELTVVWFKTRNRQRFVPFLDFEPLLERLLSDIRQEFDLLPFSDILPAPNASIMVWASQDRS